MSPWIFALTALPLGASSQGNAHQQADSSEFLRLERVWNQAHVQGDTAVLAQLWADDLRIEVPGMTPMSKGDALAFWRGGGSNIRAYETSGIEVRIERDSVIVRGRLWRQRDFGGRLAEDDWTFSKIYRWLGGHWQVVTFRAQATPGLRDDVDLENLALDLLHGAPPPARRPLRPTCPSSGSRWR